MEKKRFNKENLLLAIAERQNKIYERSKTETDQIKREKLLGQCSGLNIVMDIIHYGIFV